MTSDSRQVARVPRRERIANLDVLRGIAILFILFMNIQYMGDLGDPDYFPRRISWTSGDQAAWWVNRLIDGTQRGLLELLFGAGVLIMARTAMTPSGPVAVADLHLRRNLWLMVFGVAHGLIFLWPGEILFSYGTAALLVFAFRTLNVRQLLIIGIAVNAVLVAGDFDEYRDRQALVERVSTAQMHQTAGTPPTPADAAAIKEWRTTQNEVAAPDPRTLADTIAKMHGGWQSFVAFQQQSWAYVQFTGIGIYFENVVEAFGTMLIGMALFKLGIVQGTAAPRTYWWLLIAGYGTGLALRIPAIIAELHFDAQPDIGMFTHPLARLPMTIGHLAAVSLALSTPIGRRLLRPFEASGRMPLTVYFSASATAIIVFGPPLGLWGRFGFGTLFAMAVVIIAVQLLAANLWLRRFETGPAEWLWKSLAYNRRQPWQRANADAGAEVLS